MASRSLMPFSRNIPMSRWSEDTDPFLAMRREMNRLFDDAFSGFGLPDNRTSGAASNANGTMQCGSRLHS